MNSIVFLKCQITVKCQNKNDKYFNSGLLISISFTQCNYFSCVYFNDATFLWSSL